MIIEIESKPRKKTILGKKLYFEEHLEILNQNVAYFQILSMIWSVMFKSLEDKLDCIETNLLAA